MSSTVYQGLQSCFDTRLVQQRSLCLRLVSPKKQENPTEDPDMESPPRKCSDNHTGPEELGSFSSITSLTDTQQEKSNYIHPPLPLRRSSSLLSEKSLELCTENLGCETGSNITENNYFPSPLPSPSACSHQSEVNKSWGERRKAKSNMNRRDKCGTFPPPLSSIAGGACIHVKPHREEGRLVLKAITSPSPCAYFQAERSEGRLRLRLLNRSSSLTARTEADEEEEKEHHEDQDSKEVVEKQEMGDMGYLETSRNVEVVNGVESCGGEIGIGKIQRPINIRCNEGEHGNKGMLSWEPFWVASS